ncbi:MAG: class I SAM-dependent methyltransferase [Acidimicrobiales bacterium]|nr:class I SAM-dependent methyltransferase [Acidimicrobiales bacterium]
MEHGDGTSRSPSAATERLLRLVLGDDAAGMRVVGYDGTELGDPQATTTLRITSPDFLRRVIAGRGSELAFSRAYVAGDVEVEGDIYDILALRDRIGSIRFGPSAWRDAAAALGIHGFDGLTRLRPPPAPPEEINVAGRLHSVRRDAKAISSHYDVSNDFYRLFLGPTMTYSCAVFEHANDTLEQAQSNKYELICRKLGLRPGMRLLDIGCGWGGMALHAARQHGVSVVGVTIASEQRDLARKRVADAGLAGQIDIRLQDYREVADGPFDAVSSIGMFEHVGSQRLGDYFGRIEQLLTPGGRLLNHAINYSQPPKKGGPIDPDGFMGRYVFPDGELLEPGQVVSAINSNGLEVRHLESLREHYALTLREWVRRLEDNWSEAVRLTSPGRARVWRLYMAASALGFESNELSITQILASKTDGGDSKMELRPTWGV